MIFFVCEGREMTSGVFGLTTADVANVLLDLDCVEAINLDGGGSSCMLVNGKETIKVSDGTQRAVASALIIK
jgi:exopolysaccharide biosynthesis protein